VADVSVLLIDSNGSLQQVQDTDVLLAAGLDRRASSGNLTIGASVTGAGEDIIIGGALSSTGEVILADADSLVRVAGDLDLDGQMAGTLDMGGNHIDDIATAHYNSWATGNSGSAIDIDFDTYQARTVTLNAANVAIELQTPRGPGAFKLILIQDGIGGRNVTWSTEGSESIYAPIGTLAPDTNANVRTLYGLIYDGSDWTCVKSGSMQTV